MILTDQSEACIQVMWSVSTNRRKEFCLCWWWWLEISWVCPGYCYPWREEIWAQSTQRNHLLISLISLEQSVICQFFSRSLKSWIMEDSFLWQIISCKELFVSWGEQKRKIIYNAYRPSFSCYLTVFENRSINHQQALETQSAPTLLGGPVNGLWEKITNND